MFANLRHLRADPRLARLIDDRLRVFGGTRPVFAEFRVEATVRAIQTGWEPVFEHLRAEMRVELVREPRVVRGHRRGTCAAQRQQGQRETKPFFHISPLWTARTSPV